MKLESKTLFLVALSLALPLALAARSGAQEHPEHPKERPKVVTKHDLTVDELANAIAAHIKEQGDAEGYMKVHDPVTGKDLEMKLLKVHRERVAKVAPDTYFACTDLLTRDGVDYDLDFFMKGRDAHALKFQDMSIHKVAGKARYTWYDDNGIWKKKPVEMSGAKPDHR